MITLRRIVLIAFLAVFTLGVPAVSQATLVPDTCINSSIGCSICDVILVITNAANIMAGTLSGVSLIMFIIGGMMLIFSAGNEEYIQNGKKILSSTVVGLIIVFLAWSIIGFIVRVAFSANMGTDYQAGVDPSLFGSDNWKWWQPPQCKPPSPPKSCKGLNIGDSCAAGDCAGNKGSCYCYRKDMAADSNDCLVDAKNIAEASGADAIDDSKNTSALKGACACTNSCLLLNETDEYKTGKKSKVQVSCIVKDSYDSKKQTGLSYFCEIPGGEPGVCIESPK